MCSRHMSSPTVRRTEGLEKASSISAGHDRKAGGCQRSFDVSCTGSATDATALVPSHNHLTHCTSCCRRHGHVHYPCAGASAACVQRELHSEQPGPTEPGRSSISQRASTFCVRAQAARLPVTPGSDYSGLLAQVFHSQAHAASLQRTHSLCISQPASALRIRTQAGWLPVTPGSHSWGLLAQKCQARHS